MVSSITSFYTLHFYLLMIQSLLKGAFKSPQFSDSTFLWAALKIHWRKQKCIAKKEEEIDCPACLETARVGIYMWSEQHICDSTSDKITDCPHCRASEETQVSREGGGGAFLFKINLFYSCQCMSVSPIPESIRGQLHILHLKVVRHLASSAAENGAWFHNLYFHSNFLAGSQNVKFKTLCQYQWSMYCNVKSVYMSIFYCDPSVKTVAK